MKTITSKVLLLLLIAVPAVAKEAPQEANPVSDGTLIKDIFTGMGEVAQASVNYADRAIPHAPFYDIAQGAAERLTGSQSEGLAKATWAGGALVGCYLAYKATKFASWLLGYNTSFPSTVYRTCAWGSALIAAEYASPGFSARMITAGLYGLTGIPGYLQSLAKDLESSQPGEQA